MSEETQEATQENQAPPEAPDSPPDPRPEGWDQVAMDEQTQKRFNRIYAQMKQQEAGFKQMAEDNRKLADQLASMKEDQETARVSDRVERLKSDKIKALEDGEHARVAEIDDQILELKTPKAQPKSEPKPEADEPSWFTEDKVRALQAWQQEADESGNVKRPWATEGHPKHARCVEITNGVLNDPDFMGAEMSEILSEVDRLMAPKRPPPPPVLSGKDGPRPKPKNEVKLTEEQKYVAQKMYPHLSVPEALKRYEAAVINLGDS